MLAASLSAYDPQPTSRYLRQCAAVPNFGTRLSLFALNRDIDPTTTTQASVMTNY